MTPYATFIYFGLVGIYVAVPVVLARLARRESAPWLKQALILFATAVMLTVQYSVPIHSPAAKLVWQLWIVAGYVLVQYLLATALLSYRTRAKAKWPGHVAVVLALAPLLLAKALPVNLDKAAAGPAGAVGAGGLVEFVGLSYATLRAVDVLIGIHDGLVKAVPAARYFAFLVFFPTVSSGPIDRWRRFSDDWTRRDARAGFLTDLDGAVHRLFTGFFYKFVLAHLIAQYWMNKVPATPTPGHTVSYMYAYSFYLFFDFAGYSAFAIACSYLLGIHAPENFDQPFISRNIKEFWTRWHISLSFWFRDFIYMRFLLFAFKKKWFKNKNHAAYVANFVTFGAMGFWHGTATHYLVYGVYHACLITAHDIFARWNKPRPGAPGKVWGESLPWQIGGALVTFQAVCFGFLIFSGRQLW